MATKLKVTLKPIPHHLYVCADCERVELQAKRWQTEITRTKKGDVITEEENKLLYGCISRHNKYVFQDSNILYST